MSLAGGQRLILGRSSSASGARVSPAFPQLTRAQRGAGGVCETVGRAVQPPRRELCPVQRVRCRRALGARGCEPLKRVRAIALCCAQHAARLESRLDAQGRLRTSPSPLHQLLFASASFADISRETVSFSHLRLRRRERRRSHR